MELIKNLMDQNLQSLSNIKVKEDEYEKNDIIYCKKCNTPRTTVVELFGNKRVVRCICKCQKEARDREEQQQKELEKQLRLAKLQEASLLSNRYKNVNFNNCITGENNSFDIAFSRCKKYCEKSNEILEKGFGIYIYGDKGTGKTHLTSCMANELIRQYKQVLFTNFFEISKSIRATFKGKGNEIDLINKIANVDFLFIDDLGTEKVTKEGEDTWLQDKIFEVINKRYNNMKPTIFTSNYSLQELVQDRGLLDKTVDRILEMSTAILKVKGRSNRAKREENNLF
jgi:DNA replication protein DnaC